MLFARASSATVRGCGSKIAIYWFGSQLRNFISLIYSIEHKVSICLSVESLFNTSLEISRVTILPCNILCADTKPEVCRETARPEPASKERTDLKHALTEGPNWLRGSEYLFISEIVIALYKPLKVTT